MSNVPHTPASMHCALTASNSSRRAAPPYGSRRASPPTPTTSSGRICRSLGSRHFYAASRSTPSCSSSSASTPCASSSRPTSTRARRSTTASARSRSSPQPSGALLLSSSATSPSSPLRPTSRSYSSGTARPTSARQRCCARCASFKTSTSPLAASPSSGASASSRPKVIASRETRTRALRGTSHFSGLTGTTPGARRPLTCSSATSSSSSAWSRGCASSTSFRSATSLRASR
mmetsp:Transcript_80201/g.194363  ORF Transcript_80201/g.194363 Transcript_80201/m.194363 type:complete len:233 (-) Transcript_80201:56-754(-)